MLFWNRGLGDIALGLYAIVHRIRESIPDAKITVDQEKGGPPTGKPINIEISGDDFDELI